MAIVMKNGDEIRVPGRAVPESKARKGILGIADMLPLSEFRKMPMADRAMLIKDALKAKGEFERSAKYHEVIIRERFGSEGIRGELIAAACKMIAEMQGRLPSHGYGIYWMKNPGPLDFDDLEAAGLNPNICEGELPYSARLVQLSVSLDGTKGAFITREIIDADCRGRQFRWKAFRMEKGGRPIEIAEDHAYEMERLVFFRVDEICESALVIGGTCGRKEV
jgi:hypothetical protein